MARRMLDIFKPASRSFASGKLNPGNPITLKLHQNELKVIPKESKAIACSNEYLESLYNSHQRTAEIGAERGVSRGLLEGIDPLSVLKKPDFKKITPDLHKKSSIARAASIAAIEDVVDINEAVAAAMKEKDGRVDPKKHKEIVDATINILAKEMKLGSQEVPLTGDTVPLFVSAKDLEIGGYTISFAKNDKLYSILSMQSPVHEFGFVEVQDKFTVFRLTKEGKDHGCHHSVACPVELKEGTEAINIRDVIKYYAADLGARGLNSSLQKLGTTLEKANDAQIKQVVQENPIYFADLEKGDNLSHSQGLAPSAAATNPIEIILYFHREYKKDYLDKEFYFYDPKTGKEKRVAVTYDAPRQEIRTVPRPHASPEALIPSNAKVGLHDESNVQDNIAPEHRKTPKGP